MAKNSSKLKLILVGLTVLGLLVLARALHADRWLKSAVEWIGSLGYWGPVIFVLLYIVACIFLVPGSVLTLGAGAIFGVVKGSIVCSIAATLGATAAFLVGRYVARDWVAAKIAGNERFAAIDRAVAGEGWKIVGLTRLSPVFPFVLLNYAFGVTSVSLRDYFFASWIGMMPGTVMYVYLGSLANAAAAQEKSPAQWAFYGVGLLATVVVTLFVTRVARQALAGKLPGPPKS